MNGVKGVSSLGDVDVSPGKESIKIGTWNVRNLYQSGKLENVKQEMIRLNVNILGICETRWKSNGDIKSDEHRMIYSGGDKHERGVGLILDSERSKCVLGFWQVSDRVLLVKLKGKPFNISIIVVYAPTSESTEDDIESFYDNLDTAKAHCKSHEIILVMGDLNAKVGKGQSNETTGKYGLGKQNDRGDRWVEWCNRNNQIITNTWFEQHPRRLWTWRSPGGDIKNQIDYITINKRFKNAIKDAKSYPSGDCGSDHIPVICRLEIRLKKMMKAKVSPKLQYDSLRNNSNIKDAYNVSVRNRFEVLEDEGHSKWDIFKDAVGTTAKEIIPKKDFAARQKWITTDILDRMKDRQKITKRESPEYKHIDKEIRKKCREAKEVWINNKCEEIERYKNVDSAAMHKKIKEISGQKSCSASGCIKSKQGTIIMEKKEILERWTEYITELFHDCRGEKPAILKNLEGPTILRSEVQAALAKMKRNKATGPDEISAEMLEALDDYGLEKLTELINEIYDSGDIPEDLSKSIFIALPKKAGATECELHRTISLMSHIIKVVLRIIMTRVRNKIKPEIGQEQCGFVKDSGTRNAIFMIRMLSERAIEMQRDVYMCFIDFTKAFDKVQHEKLFEILNNIDIDGKDLRLIRNLYWEQTACMRVNNETSEYVKIERGVRQGCVLSPDLFNLYSEKIFMELDDQQGFIVGGYNFNNARYADDAVLVAGSERKLQQMLDKVVEEGNKMGMAINCKKTECLVVSKRKSPRCELRIGEVLIKQVDKFSYLGSIITEDGKCDIEIKRRIGMAKDTFNKLEKVLKSRKMLMSTKKRVLECYVISVLLYGSECWTISPTMRKRLEAVEMWFYRRMLRLSWTEHTTNEEVLTRANAKRSLINIIRERQLKFLGHVMRKEGLENLVLTGFIEGKRSRGRQRLMFLQSLNNWMVEQVAEKEKKNVNIQGMIRTMKDRNLWKVMIANVLKGCGT